MTAPRRWPAALILLLCLAAAAIAVVYPIYVIRPFRAQGARELTAALFVLQIRSWLTVLSTLIAIVVAARLWILSKRKAARAMAAVAALLTAVFAVLARVNVYEIMFHPAERPSFAEVGQSKLDPGEKVIAVRIGSQARAYPVRIISYHHIINDVVDGAAIVATY